jgi:hypothetical protein
MHTSNSTSKPPVPNLPNYKTTLEKLTTSFFRVKTTEKYCHEDLYRNITDNHDL